MLVVSHTQIPSRLWFMITNVCFLDVAVFPGLVESIDAEDWANAKRWVDVIESRILNAEKTL